MPSRARGRNGWKWALGAIVTAIVALAILAALSPEREIWYETCDICASHRETSRVTKVFGLVCSSLDSRVRDSAIVVDRLIPFDHVHKWSMSHGGGHGLFVGSYESHGRLRYGRFAEYYCWFPEFRRAVHDAIGRDELTLPQVRRELEEWRNFTASNPRAPVIQDLLKQFDRPPERIR